jgi:4-amino-4-deoxy-L-arabinose transferase-like glycosyltransferase
MRVWTGALVAALVALPWFWLAFKENGFSFIAIFFINHHLARYVSDLHHHEQAIYYFLPILVGLFFPWSGWLPALVLAPLRWQAFDWRTWDRGAVFLACWVIFPVLFFSLSTSKLPGYILPSLPPLALLLGRSLVEAIEKPDGKRAIKIAQWAYLVLSLGVAVALPIVMQVNFGTAWSIGLVMSAVVLLPAILAFQLARRGRHRGAVQATVVQGLILVLATTQFGFPALAAYHSTRDIARQALAADLGGEPLVTYGYFHHTLHYYTGYRIRANLVDLPSLADYARAHSGILVVTEADRIPEIKTLPGFSVTPVGEQGNLRLLRITVKPG